MAPGYYDINPLMGLYGSIPQNTMGLPLQSGTYTPDSLHLATVLSGNQLASNCCDAYTNPFLNPYSANTGMTGDTISFMTNMINSLPQFGPNQGGLMNMLETFNSKFPSPYSNFTNGIYSSTPSASLTTEEKVAAAEKQADAKVAIEKSTDIIKRICDKAGISASIYEAPSTMSLEEQKAYYDKISEKLKLEYSKIWETVETEINNEKEKAADPEKEAQEAKETAKNNSEKIEYLSAYTELNAAGSQTIAKDIADEIERACDGTSADNTVIVAANKINEHNVLAVMQAYGNRQLTGFWGFAGWGGGYLEDMITSISADLPQAKRATVLTNISNCLIAQAEKFEVNATYIGNFRNEVANMVQKSGTDKTYHKLSHLFNTFANMIIDKQNEYRKDNGLQIANITKINTPFIENGYDPEKIIKKTEK